VAWWLVYRQLMGVGWRWPSERSDNNDQLESE
jgi:hypothetical protein